MNRNGTQTDLSTADGGDNYGFGINNSGQVAGYSFGSGTGPSGFVFGPNGVTYSSVVGFHPTAVVFNLTSPVGKGAAIDINDRGQYTGWIYYGGAVRGFVTFATPTGSRSFVIPTLGGGNSYGFAINDSAQVTGYAENASAQARAYLYSSSDQSTTDLGTLPGDSSSVGHDINASGQITGYSSDANGKRRAFLYSSGTMIDLNSLVPAESGWKLLEGRGINDAGQITGYGIHNGNTRAFLLDPPSAEVTLSTASLSLTEGGVPGIYTLALTSAPNADVVVTISPDNQVSASLTQLTFTSANWNTPQTVAVQAIQDDIAEGNHTGIVSHTSVSIDARYNGLAIGKVTVSITDAVIPTVAVSVPAGTVWTQPDLPVTGTAAPGATVTLTVNNVTTDEVRAVSAVADANGIWSLTLIGLTDGSYELQPEAGGITGSKVTVVVDSHVPVSTLSVTSNNGPNASGWYTGPVNLAVSAIDGVGGQGVARSEYTLDGGAWTVFPGSGLNLAQDGSHTVCYRSVDKANNTEAARCLPVPIDATAPVVNPVFDAASNLLHLNAQDSVSGIASIEISRDGGQTWTAHSGPAGFTRDGSYTAQYRVRDNAGNLATGQTTVTVMTVPIITAPADQTAFEAASQSFNLGSFADQAADNPWNVDIDWGDGSAHNLFTLAASGALGSLPHTYADNGTYTVTIKVTDQAGNTGSKIFKIAVANVAPTATFTATTGPLNEGGVATLTFSNPADQSPIDTQAGFRYAFDCGDGAGFGAAGTVNSITCAVLDNPNQIIKGKVLDKDGGATEYSAVIVINNVLPVLGVIAGPSAPVQRDTPATITVDFTDAGVRDTHTATIDWDDGTMSAGTVSETNGSGSISASHSYAKPGHYVVTLTVTDKDGGSASAIYKAIQVKGGPPVK